MEKHHVFHGIVNRRANQAIFSIWMLDEFICWFYYNEVTYNSDSETFWYMLVYKGNSKKQ